MSSVALKTTASKANKFSVVLGTMTFGWSKSSGVCDDAVSKEMMEAFAKSSPEHIEVDTAYLYSNGETEKIIGRVMPTLSENASERLEVATKVAPWSNLISGKGGVHGASGGAGGLKPDMVRLQLETSLKRMNVDKVHLLYLHAPDIETPLIDTLTAINELHKEGKFVELGLSNFSAWETVEVWHICDKNNFVKPTVYQGMYNAIARQVERELFPALKRHGIRFLCYNPLAAGLLTGKHDFSKEPAAGRFKDNSMYMARYWKKEYFDALNKVQEACKTAGEDNLAEVSLRWLKHHSLLEKEAGDGVIIGASSMTHLNANLKACDDGQPLAENIVKAFDDAWEICRDVCPKYFRP